MLIPFESGFLQVFLEFVENAINHHSFKVVVFFLEAMFGGLASESHCGATNLVSKSNLTTNI
jgi:hypothetical protein